MTTLTCPKCRQGVPDDALDVGHCPACGFPLDGPLVLDGAAKRRSSALLLALAGLIVISTGVAGYAIFDQVKSPTHNEITEVSGSTNTNTPGAPIGHLAPFPRLAKPRDTQDPTGSTATNSVGPIDQAPPAPGAEPKKNGPRPIGVVMKVDPKIAPNRVFDHPDDTAALPDLNSGDRVVLTGKVRALRIGSVNGKGSIDAAGLIAEEIVITGDLNGEAVVLLNAPGGKVTIGGYVGGTSKLTVIAPDGTIVLTVSGRLTGSATMTVTTKRLEIAGNMLGGARLHATLTTGGSFKFATAEEGAIATYKKAADSDPPIIVEGVIRGGARVHAE